MVDNPTLTVTIEGGHTVTITLANKQRALWIANKLRYFCDPGELSVSDKNDLDTFEASVRSDYDS